MERCERDGQEKINNHGRVPPGNNVRNGEEMADISLQGLEKMLLKGTGYLYNASDKWFF